MAAIYFVVLIQLAFWLTTVYGGCTLYVNGNSPLFVKNFGSRKVLLQKQISNIELEEGEKLQAFCSTGLELGRKSVSQKSIELECIDGSIQYKHKADYYSSSEISCRGRLVPDLYESQRKLPNCGNYMSYAIGVAPENFKEIISTGICYDLDTLTMKYVTYLAYPPKYDFNTQKEAAVDLQVNLSKKMSNFESYFKFMSPSAFTNAFELKKTYNHLLNNYNYMSIIQDDTLHTELSKFDYIFNTVWWNGLRLGNWKLYLEALAERTKTVSYIVSMGTSGTVSMPTTTCNKTEILTIEADGITVNAPKYIWAKLESLPANESFVVIGYNSPFYTSSKDDIFCEDMCDKIDWLQNSLFGRVRLMPVYGVVFCCRPEEVADKFENFPMAHSEATTTTPPPELI